MQITVEELVEQIKIALNDEFVAKVKSKENVIGLTFENGQQFLLEVKKAETK